jgi:hypothetical protein
VLGAEVGNKRFAFAARLVAKTKCGCIPAVDKNYTFKAAGWWRKQSCAARIELTQALSACN